MCGLIEPLGRADIEGFDSQPEFIFRSGYRIQLKYYQGYAYAYALESSKPEESFFAIRHGNYNPVEHQDLTEMVLELLKL